MTLCLAWKQGKEIYFASDSRLTNGNSIVTNDANKIFKVKVEIYGPIPANNPNAIEPLIHQTDFGLCFAGSYINGSVLADTLEEVLSNIQASPYSDISIDNLSEIAFAVYKIVTKQLMNLHQMNGLSEVLLGGYCPKNKDLKLFRFSPKFEPGELIDFQKQQIVLDSQTIVLGNGKAKATSLLPKLNGDYTHFHLLREVIQDDDVPSVGGNIQAGLFRQNNFKLYGIAESSLFTDDYGFLQVKDSLTFRGIQFNFDDSELRKGNININKSFFTPFEKERDENFKKANESIDDNIRNFKKKDKD